MKAWQWFLCAILVVVALLIPMPEDAPNVQGPAVELKGSVMPEVEND